MRLEGKRVLVTGGNRRVGAVIVRHLADLGAKVVIHARQTHRRELEKLLDTLPSDGHRMVLADFLDPGALPVMAQAARDCEAIIFNASLYRHNYCGGDAGFDKALEQVNCRFALQLLEIWKTSPAARSVVAVLDQAIYASDEKNPYQQSRVKLWQGMLALAQKCQGIRFNAVAPGPMLPPPELLHSTMEKTIAQLPLKRAVDPMDLARSAVFLLTCESLTGSLLTVDCGQSVARRLEKKLI